MAKEIPFCKSCNPGPEDDVLEPVVEAMCATNDGLARARGKQPCWHVLPSRDSVISIVEDLRSVLFPGYFGTSELTPENIRFHVGSTLDNVVRSLQEQVKRGMCFVCQEETPNCPVCEADASTVTRAFLVKLPEIRAALSADIQAAYEGDPAATCPDETIFCYPGLLAITSFRIAHELFLLKVPLIPRIITEHAHSITGIDIHPGAQMGEHFFIDHGTGIVIGETTEIGNRVRLYQGVTLGAKSFPLDEDGNPIKGIPRHPIVEDDVIIYGGATILGRVTIGRGSVIGGNVWLTESVPPGSKVTQAMAQQEGFSQGAGI
ncbi:MAG: serine O-acetyltransferase EpsC [Planctomycetota bacterium]|jgi:serine O-acetyltransferase